jgi:hypothetical protein
MPVLKYEIFIHTCGILYRHYGKIIFGITQNISQTSGNVIIQGQGMARSKIRLEMA